MTTATSTTGRRVRLRREPSPRTHFALPDRVIDYPTGDEKPMAETDAHVDLISYGRECLKLHYSARAEEV